jgi:hypothetical protein
MLKTVNGWIAKNKIHTASEPTFAFHGEDITANAVDDEPSLEPLTAAAPPERTPVPLPPQPVFRPDPDQLASPHESPPAIDPSQIRGGSEPTIINGDHEPTPDEVFSPELPLDVTESPIPEVDDSPSANVRTYLPKAPIEMREKSTRIRKPPVQFNLGVTSEPRATLEEARRAPTTLMSMQRGLKLFRTETEKAIELEVTALLSKTTFEAVDADKPPNNQRKRTLRSIMNVVEKYLPTLDSAGNRALDKVKARLCVGGRGQNRGEYLQEEIEFPTANIASIFTIAQIAAAEGRFVMVGDVGSAYLNALMPRGNQVEILYMAIEPDVAREIIRQDSSFLPFQRRNGGLIVILNKALDGCIESAKLWYYELAGTLKKHGFTANPRDICIFSKTVRAVQFTIDCRLCR